MEGSASCPPPVFSSTDGTVGTGAVPLSSAAAGAGSSAPALHAPSSGTDPKTIDSVTTAAIATTDTVAHA